MKHTHWDTVTEQTCSVVPTMHIDLAWTWVKFHENGRPRTRKQSEVITLQEQAVRLEERARQAQARVPWGSTPTWDQALQFEKLQHICEVQQATLKWLHDNVISYRKDYNSKAWTRPILGVFASNGNTLDTPQWVLDCLATVTA